jgi:hypothetical protein
MADIGVGDWVRFKGPFFVTTYLVNDKGQKEIVKRKKETRQFDCTVAELIDPRTGKAYKLKRWQRDRPQAPWFLAAEHEVERVLI